MKNLANIQRAVTAEPEFRPDEVFKNDSLLLDYLHALLTPPSSIDTDSDEIQHSGYSNESVRKFSGVSNSIFDPSIIFGAAQSKLEVATLRNEIESLKFKMELASLDVQVLRSENDKLKDEIAARQKQHIKVMDSLERAKSENSELASRIAALQIQLDAATIPAENSTPDISVDSVPADENESEVNATQAEPDDTTDRKPNSDEDTGVSQTVHCNEVPVEAAAIRTPEQTLAVGLSGIDERTAFGIAADRTILSRPAVFNESASRKSGNEVVLFPSRQVAAEQFHRNFIPASKVIKQQDAEMYQPRQELHQAVEVLPLPPLQTAEITIATECTPVFSEPHQVEVPKVFVEADSAMDKDSLPALESDEIDLDPAPTPQAVVRKTVSKYEAIQKEAGSFKTVLSEHDIIS